MADRLRELPYPAVPEQQRDPGFPDRIKTCEFREAFLARLIARAKTLKPGYPPADVPTVRDASAARVTEDIGPLGRFARRLRPMDGSNLHVQEAWEAWCEQVGTDATEQEAGFVKRRNFARQLTTLARPPLPDRRRVSSGGKVAHGWRGWMLAPAESSGEPGSVTPLPETATSQDAVEASDRLNTESASTERQIREKLGWPEPYIEGPQRAVRGEVVLDDKGEVVLDDNGEPRVEPVFWPHPAGDHRLEARYLQREVQKLSAGTHSRPSYVKNRIARWLVWVAWEEQLDRAILELGVLRSVDAIVTHEVSIKRGLWDRLDEFGSTLGSHNRSMDRCAAEIKRFARAVCTPLAAWAVYAVPDGEDVWTATAPEEAVLRLIERMDKQTPLSVGESPSAALAEANTADSRDAARWLIVGVQKTGEAAALNAAQVIDGIRRRGGKSVLLVDDVPDAD